jgi:hypothetical protein
MTGAIRAAAILGLMLLGAPARGQGGTRAEAERAFAEGAEHYRRGDYEKALEAFTRSYAQHRHYLTLCNLARCHEHAGRPLKAAEHYRRCLQEGGDGSTKADSIRAALRAVEARLAWLAIRVSSGEATAFVDGQAVGSTPARVMLEPGRHAIELRRGAARSRTHEVELKAGEQRSVLLELSAPPSAASAPSSTAPAAETRPAARGRRLRPVWFWTAVALSVACGVTSAVLGASTMSANRAYETDPTKEGYDRVIQRRDLTNAFFGLSLGGLAASGVLFYFTGFRSAPAADDAGFDVVLAAGGRF